MIKINKKKYENTVLYIASKLEGGEIRGKKKLAKLLYYVDFDFFEKYERPVTGDVYLAWPMGPVPATIGKIVHNLQQDNKLNINEITNVSGYLPTEVYKVISKPDLSVFEKEEIEMMDRVINKYGDLNGMQLENLTHAEAPYIGTEPSKEIAYELAFYRGTDFIGND